MLPQGCEDPQVQAMARPLLPGSHATPTPPKCRPGAHQAPINNLSILLPPILLFFTGNYWRLQLGVRQGLYHRVLPYLQGFQCLGGRCHPQTCRGFFWDKIQNSFCKKFTRKLELSILPLIFSCRTLPGALSNQTRQTGSIKG